MKTNKTKPIKKIMIFTIITVMIVSLFAVPAFAGDYPEGEEPADNILQNGIYWKEPTGTVSRTEYSVSNGTDTISVDATGYYVITVSYRDLLNCLDSMDYGGFPDNVYLFGSDYESALDVPNYRGFVNLKWYSEGQYWDYYRYLLVNGMDGDNEAIHFYRHPATDEWMISIPGRSGVTQEYLANYQYFEFFVPQYPLPDALDSHMTTVWNALNYTVSVVQSSVTPDPDDPIPPADGEEQGIFAVWSQITQWIVEGLASVSNAFYANGELTLLGYLCIIPLAIGVAFLLIGIIQKFLRLRG